MTTSPTGKKTGLLIGGAVALAVVAYGGMRYMESRIADEVRAVIASAPPESKLEVGDVRFSLFSNTLTIRDLRGVTRQGDLTYKLDAKELLVVKPNIDLLQPANKDKDDLPVADSVRLKGLTAKEEGLKGDISVAAMEMAGIRLDRKRYHNLANELGLTPYTAFSLSLMATSFSANDMTGSIMEGDLGISASLKSLQQKAFSRGATEGSSMDGLTVLVDKQPRLTVERILIGRTNPLEAKTYVELEKLTAKAEKNLLSEEDSLRVLGLVLGAPKPIMESTSIVNLVVTDPEFPLTMAALEFTNPSNTPFTSTIGFKNLVLPVPLITGLEGLAMMGYKTLDVSASIGIGWPSANVLQGTLDVAAKDMAEFKATLDMETQPALFSSAALLTLGKSLEQSPPKLASMSLTLDDKGLISRGGKTAQMTSGLEPDAAAALLQTMLKAIFADSMTPQKAKERLEIVMSFVNRPGKLSLKVAPPAPLTSEQVENLTGDEDFIILEAIPGPKTLKELMAEGQ